MNQNELNRAVARATDETVSEIAHHGFVLLQPLPEEIDPEDLIIDWDQLEEERAARVFPLPREMAAVA